MRLTWSRYWAVNYIDVYSLVDDTETSTSAAVGSSTASGLIASGSTSSGLTVTESAASDYPTVIVPANATTPVATPTYQSMEQTTTPTSTTTTKITTTMVSWSTAIMTLPPSSTPSFSSASSSSTLSSSALPSTTSSSPTPSNKPSIDTYSFLGCFRSSSRFRTFSLALDSPQNSIESCIAACDGLPYVGAFARRCYCAESVDADTRALADATECDVACPGDGEEFCGGLVSGSAGNGTAGRMFRREAKGYYLLTVYADLAEEAGSSLSSSVSTRSSSSIATIPPSTLTQTATVEANLVVIHPLTTTVTYTIVCPTNSASLMATQLVTVVEDCGCTQQPAVAMETKVVECDGCGSNGEDTVTVTVPVTTTATRVVGVVGTAGSTAGVGGDTVVESVFQTVEKVATADALGATETVETAVDVVGPTVEAIEMAVDDVLETTKATKTTPTTKPDETPVQDDQTAKSTASPPPAVDTTHQQFVEMTANGAATTEAAATPSASTVIISVKPTAVELETDQQTQTQLLESVQTAVQSIVAVTPQGFANRTRPGTSTSGETPAVVPEVSRGLRRGGKLSLIATTLALLLAVLL